MRLWAPNNNMQAALLLTLLGLAPATSFNSASVAAPRLATLYASTEVTRPEALAAVKSSSRLEDAMAGLSEGERYNVVLQGMLRRATGAAANEVLASEVFPLLEEMAERKGQKLSDESRSAIVDAAAASDDASAMEQSMRLSRRAGGAAFSKYACEQGALSLPPTDSRRAAALLASLPVYPTDDRGGETAAALAVLGLGFSAALWDPIIAPLTGHADDFLNPPAVAAALSALGLGADVAAGSGAVAGKVAGGVGRLFTRDPTRECRCEAASFLAAYLLGLPAFGLGPTALEALKLVDSSAGGDFGGAPGVHRLLVWLLSPVAAEQAEHRTLLASDPRQAASLLKVLRARGGGAAEGYTEADDDLRLRAALAEAELLLKRYAVTADALRFRMETGSATVGNCVALLETKQ